MLKEHIDQFYLDSQKEDKERHYFYVTDAGRCPRLIFFRFKNAPRKEMEAQLLRMWDHGDSIHRLIMRSLISMRDIHVVAAEVKTAPQELISGRADAIISDGKDLYVLDIKSIHSMAFSKNLREPKKENIDQIQLYMHFLKIKQGILLYVNKDTQELKEFILKYDAKRAKGILKDLSSLKKEIDSCVVPSRKTSFSKDWQCRCCQFKEICKMAGEKSIDWEEFKGKLGFIQ